MDNSKVQYIERNSNKENGDNAYDRILYSNRGKAILLLVLFFLSFLFFVFFLVDFSVGHAGRRYEKRQVYVHIRKVAFT